MPRSSCEPCCNPGELARHVPMWRDAVLQILCNIWRTHTFLVCDPSGVPYMIKAEFDALGETPTFTAYNMQTGEQTAVPDCCDCSG